MSLEPVGRSLERLLSAAGLSQPLRGWLAIEVWAEIVGDAAARRARATSFDAGRLIVEVDSPAWVSQLGFMKREYIEKLNQRLGEGVIREIQFIAARGERG